MSMMTPLIVAVLAALFCAAIAVFAGSRAAAQRRQRTSSPDSAQTQLVASQLAALDQRLSNGQVSQADYAAERNRLLGLPAPEQR